MISAGLWQLKVVYEQTLEEVRAGKKQTHWMWFIFPQIQGIGTSETSAYYAIGSIDEARSYLNHQLLGRRLKEITSVINEASSSADTIFGSVDAAKFLSSMTLFYRIDPEQTVFRIAIQKFFDGACDERTIGLLDEMMRVRPREV